MKKHPLPDVDYILAHFHHSPIQVAGGRPGVGVPLETIRQPTRVSTEREFAGLVKLDADRSIPMRFYVGRFIGKDEMGAHLFEPLCRLAVSHLDLDETSPDAPDQDAVRRHLSGEEQIALPEPETAGPRP